MSASGLFNKLLNPVKSCIYSSITFLDKNPLLTSSAARITSSVSHIMFSFKS